MCHWIVVALFAMALTACSKKGPTDAELQAMVDAKVKAQLEVKAQADAAAKAQADAAAKGAADAAAKTLAETDEKAKAADVANVQTAFDKAQAAAAKAQSEFDKLKSDSEAQEKAAASAKLEAAKRTVQSAGNPKLEVASKTLEDSADALQGEADKAEERAHAAAMRRIELEREVDRLRADLDIAFLLYSLAQQNSFTFSPGYASGQGSNPQLIQSHIGGFVRSAGGASVYVPPGALGGINTQISVNPVPPPLGLAGVFCAVELQPSGQHFNPPVTVTIPLGRSLAVGSPLILMGYEPGIGYTPSGTIARVIYPGNLASARLSHFSTWALSTEDAKPPDPAQALVAAEQERVAQLQEMVDENKKAIADIHDKAKADAQEKAVADATAKAKADAKAKAAADAKAKAAVDARAKAKEKAAADAKARTEEGEFNGAVQQANKKKRDEDNRRRREELGQAILDGLNQIPQQPNGQSDPRYRQPQQQQPQATPCDDCPGGKYDNSPRR